MLDLGQTARDFVIAVAVALLLAGRSRPVLVDLQAWPERPWAEQVRASQAWHKTHPAFPGGVAPAYCRPSRPEQAA